MRMNGILSFFSFCDFAVLTVYQFVERGDGPFELQKQDSHVFRKTGTFLEICWKNQSSKTSKNSFAAFS